MKSQEKKYSSKNFWFILAAIISVGCLWLLIDRPVSQDLVRAVVTQGVWKIQRYSNTTYQGVARVEDGATIHFTTYRSVPVGTQIYVYRYRRPISGITTYAYNGP
ncbi:hypothetical protein IAI53_07310 [Thauera sp. CAU 1555]|uniref:DUF3592 domain-containing protein n=1 Tax=Thauera sedimentorum TaxID=2767595 RepID=A0ABR9B943_9RHOO|nr:hypothetical protein [Thauera sedimentorum]MBC9071772.1 hypothetical protein [Thauera sedimentorum]MBD8502691.1 hypothetical protein [Thauera sedimentorum]